VITSAVCKKIYIPTRDTPTSCRHNLVENTTSLSERKNFKTK